MEDYIPTFYVTQEIYDSLSEERKKQYKYKVDTEEFQELPSRFRNENEKNTYDQPK